MRLRDPDSWEESRPLRARTYGILLGSLGTAIEAAPAAAPAAATAAATTGVDVDVVEWLRIGTNPLTTVVVPVPVPAGDGLRDMDFDGRLTFLLATCHADHAALRPELQIRAAVVLYAWSVHGAGAATELHTLARAVAVAAAGDGAGTVLGGLPPTPPTSKGHIHVVARWRTLLHGVGLLAEALEVTAGKQPAEEEGRALPAAAAAWLLVPDALLYASLAGGAAGGGARDEGAGGGAAFWAAMPSVIVGAV